MRSCAMVARAQFQGFIGEGQMNIRGTLSSAALAAAAATLLSAGGAWATVTCAPIVGGPFNGLTAAVVETGAFNLSSPVDGTGCDIAVYCAPGSSGSITATISGTSNFAGVVVDGASVDVVGSTVTTTGNVGIFYANGANCPAEKHSVCRI